jgi:small nuclear ribonucleoprotein (snRNP)-like protein
LTQKKRGAELIITKKDGQQIEGELITVKPNSLLLLNTVGKDISVEVEEIKVIEIENKSKLGKGALYGLLIIGGTGAILCGLAYGSSYEGENDLGVRAGALRGALYFAPAGALIGAMVGLIITKADETIQIEKMTDSEIQATLDKLRKKARIRDYK